MISSIDSAAPDPSVVSNISTLPFVRLSDPPRSVRESGVHRSGVNPLPIGR